ncbi:hypothetical protein AXG93_3217s1460 [Marchantia polymorpha subsp. ruderalis]|uniref:Uncharacterized protein n=1 Tax=Marchantia polymorpha subsp. ruderalis TaxID=1480154 RepID=A0A176VWE8_MARPO|nr:hypothetical protein AXG93_3217s1460 [Marchantia polymorpha subsp. ruderalis]
MEGAGEFIGSHAAELATREKDSTNEEQELPSAIQDLIRRLEGEGEPITRLPDLKGPEFLEFFPNRGLHSTIIGWRSQVRLRVLEAIGSCNTLEILDVYDICGGYISRLTATEWEILLRGFRCSTVLRKISVYDLRWSSDAERERWCLQLGTILNTSSVTVLGLGCCSLSARCFLNLASGLRGNSESKLKTLNLFAAWEDWSAVKHVADMINSAPLLETLRLGGFYEDTEDETVGILSQALIQSSSLKELLLKSMEWGAALLLKALAGDDRNRSIECLRLADTIELGGCLTELLISNPSLKEVELSRMRMSPEEWYQLGEVIRDNAIATTILAKFDLGNGDQWKSTEALARSASSDIKDPTVELVLEVVSTSSNDHEVMLSLNLIGRVLRGEIKSLKSLSILVGDKKMITFSFLPMNGKTGETLVLKKLELSVRSEDLSKGVWEDLIRCMRGNHLTHLDLADSQLNEEAFRELMGILQVNLALQEIDFSRTSWARDGKAAQIQEALKQNQKRAVYMSVFREANLTFGDAKAGRLFLCGSPRAVLGVIQTFCVEMLIPSHLRGAILIEKLKSDFICSINDKLEEMLLESSHLMQKEELFHYEHCWPPIERHTGGRSERARDLLWESDVEAVVNEIRQKRIEELKSLVEGLISVENDLAQSNPEAENMVSDSNFFQMKDCKPPTSRLSAVMHNGTTVRLQLMCESMTGFHTVKDQEGLKIRLDRENSSWIRKIIEISYKVMYYAVKAGLDKTLNLGQAIPEWEDLKSDIVQLDGISDDDHRAFLKGGESKELQDAWLRIQQTLAPQLQNRYSGIFKLYQVKYLSLERGGHAWVCEKCMNKGLRCGILTC